MISTLYAQPYDMDAIGFYFKSMKEYKEKYLNNYNSWGGQVEEYEYQLIEGEGTQELLNHLELEEFFDIVDSWKSEAVERIEDLAEILGWDGVERSACEIEEQIERLSVIESGNSMDDLGSCVMEVYAESSYRVLEGSNLKSYFDFKSWMDDYMTGNQAITKRDGGKYKYISYEG